MKTFRVQVALTLLLAAVATVSAMSIENEQPVKVTHHNSGPRYEIGDVDRARAQLREQAGSSTPPAVERPEGGQEGEQAPAVGHIALRRIFLFPIMRPQGGDEQPLGGNSGREQEEPSEQTPRVPMMIAKPLWPFMMPARPSPGQTGQPAPDSDNEHHDERPHIIRHLFGADEASRSPDMDRAPSNERDQSRQQPLGPHAAFDPIQMMMDMMHQAISGQLGREFAKDLNKDQAESARPTGGDNSPAESSDERPTMPQVLSMRPGSQNETREDIVEIEGRKYVRKTLINRHVGDNLVFMTRRLIFIPLNETTDEPTETTAGGDTPTTTTTTTELPPSSTSVQPSPSESDERPTPSSVRGEDKPKSETPETSSVATTTTTASEQPSPAAPESAEQTTPNSSAVEPVTAATAATEPAKNEAAPESKAAERLVEGPAGESNSAPKLENGNEKEKEAPKASSP